jgi:hypothetical protein
VIRLNQDEGSLEDGKQALQRGEALLRLPRVAAATVLTIAAASNMRAICLLAWSP